MPSAVITGVGGQDGRYLADLLVSKGYHVCGLTRPGALDKDDELHDKADVATIDLRSDNEIRSFLEKTRPDEIYNLAAISSLEEADADPLGTSDLNGRTPLRFLEAISDLGADGEVRFCQASSSQVFGPPDGHPRDETTPLRPHNAYAEAKAAAQLAVSKARTERGLFASTAILFNHESPRRSTRFVSRKISRAVARISAGLEIELRLQNLTSTRDWGFAGDYVQAMWSMLQADDPDDFVIATGKTHAVADFVREAFAQVGIVEWEGYVAAETETGEIGSPGISSKATTRLGWTPTTAFPELVGLMVEHDRRVIAGHVAERHS